MRNIIRMIVVILVFSIFVIGCNYPEKTSDLISENIDKQNISINDEKNKSTETTEIDRRQNDNSNQEINQFTQISMIVPQENKSPVQVSREESSHVSNNEPLISEEPSQIIKDEPQISDEPPEISNIPVDDTFGSNNDGNIFIQNKLKNTLIPICQYPELPTGCEITALTTVLHYYGLNADKCYLADNYLEKGPVGTVDFHMAFVGDPRSEYSYGCYAPAIVTTANRFLNEQDTELIAYDKTGTGFEELFSYTEKSIPVIVWCTIDLKPGRYTTTWNIDGKDITWYSNEHCMVLLGQEGNHVYTADPTTGTIETYPKKLMETRYKELFEQAVIIY